MTDTTYFGAKLYAVYLGGDPAPGRLGEDHEVVFVVAADVKAARKAARPKWTGIGRSHVDAVREITTVDGYRIDLTETGEAEIADIDVTNGLRANRFCPIVARETFLAGTEPESCQEHGGVSDQLLDWWRRLREWWRR